MGGKVCLYMKQFSVVQGGSQECAGRFCLYRLAGFHPEALPEQSVTAVTSYVQYCERMLIPSNTVKSNLNSKPWLTVHLKRAIQAKQAFATEHRVEGRASQNSIKVVDSPSHRTLQVMGGGHVSNWQSEAGLARPFCPHRERPCQENHREEGRRGGSICHRPEFLSLWVLHSWLQFSSDCLRNDLQCSCSWWASQCSLSFLQLWKNTILTLWNRSKIRSIPKSNRPVKLNDYRFVALTLVLVKCVEYDLATFHK